MKKMIYSLLQSIFYLSLFTSYSTEIVSENNIILYSNINETRSTFIFYTESPSNIMRMCDHLKGLSPGQRKHCHLYEDHMETVKNGIKTSLTECQRLFKHHKWNCTLGLQHSTFFGPNFKPGNKEAAFLQAVTSAGIMHAIARSCRDGQLTRCSCSSIARPIDLYKDWIWRGCSDNLEYAYKFTRNLMDIKEQEKIPHSKRNDNEYSRSLMTLHNNEAGRRAVLKMTQITCKCHGVSGSCSLITCWHQLPVFSRIGDYIKNKYESAIKVKKNKKGRLQVRNPVKKKSKVTDLVYINQSPNYCVRNDSLGVLGTENRECNKTSKGVENCNVLCCGRTYNIKKVFAKEKCKCKFHWCCYVQCEICFIAKEIYTCK